MTHAIGDAPTLNRLLPALLRRDPAALEVLDDRIGAPLIFALLARRCARHPSDTLRFALAAAGQLASRGHGSRGGVRAATAPPRSIDAPAERVFMVASSAKLALFNQVRAWRDLNMPEVSVAAIFGSAVYVALCDAGLNIAGKHLHALIDARRDLPLRYREKAGNIAKGIDVEADLADPRSLAAAMKRAVTSGDAIPAMASTVIDTIRSGLRETAAPGADEPLTLTFSWISTDRYNNVLPWIADRDRVSFAGGRSPGFHAINVLARPVGSRLRIGASFDSEYVDTAQVQAALDALPTAIAALERRLGNGVEI